MLIHWLLEPFAHPCSAYRQILCDIVSDYIGCDMIDSYHLDARLEWTWNGDAIDSESAQAEENLLIFGVACERMQIPRWCVATYRDFKEKNVCTYMSGSNIAVREDRVDSRSVRHAWFGLQSSKDGIDYECAEWWVALRDNWSVDYELGDYPKSKKDHKVCENIIRVFRCEENDKPTPMTDSSEDEWVTDELHIALLSTLVLEQTTHNLFNNRMTRITHPSPSWR